MRASLVIVTGVQPSAIDSAMIGLAWDLPQAVSVRHTVDPVSQVLTRVVSDATGTVERVAFPLEHACIACALREDVLPTIDRLARDGRWSSIVLGLPTGAEAAQLTGVLASDSRLARRVRVAALARPDARVVLGAERLEAGSLVTARHPHRAARRWSDPVECQDVPRLGSSGAWRLELSSPRPFHPERMLEHVETLGTGPFRSRGVFWLPTRPGEVQEWGGAGGHLSIGTRGDWGRRTPVTRLVLTGLRPRPSDLVDAFEHLLLTHEEALLERPRWRVLEDGLEPWLGDIHDVA